MAENAFKADWPSFALGFNTGKSKGGSGGGAELNIHYGMEPPEDTSMLWVKTEEAKRVFVDPRIEFPEGGRAESIEVLSNKIGTYFRFSAHVAVGKKIYFFGGTTGTGTTATNSIRVFDTEAGVYTTLDEVIPTNLAEAAAACVGTKIYLFGGRNATNTFQSYTMLNSVYMFDLETEKIVQLACTTGNKKTNMSAIAIGSYIYVFGGCYLSESSTVREYANTSIWRFDPESQTFTILRGKFSANNSNYGMPGCAIGSKIYTIVAQKNAIYCYDTEKDEVTALGSKLPVNIVAGTGASAFENKAYFFSNGKIYRFDPESNNVETSEISLSYGTNGPAVDTVESVIYVVSGYNNKNVEKYLPQIGLMTLPYGSLKIIPKANDNVFAIINSYASYIEVGVDKVFKGNKENGGEYQEAYLYKNGAWVKI